MKKILICFLLILIYSNKSFAVQENIILGDENADVNVRIYYSMTCPSCSYLFKNIVPKLERNYVKTNKISLEFRPYPLNKSSFAIDSIIHCTKTKEKHEKALKALLKEQSSWINKRKRKEEIENILYPYLRGEDLQKCYKDKENADKLYDKIAQYRQKGIIKATPAVFVNGKEIERLTSYYQIEQKILEELSN